MAKQFIADIRDRDQVNAVFLVKEKIMAMAKNGKPYMNLRFMDRSGEIEAKVWDNVDAVNASFERDDFVQVKGKASVYLNKMQVVVNEITRLPEDEVDLGDFLPESPRPVEEMRRELDGVVAGLGDIHLRRLMELFLEDRQFMALYSKAPAAKGMHHVYLGGLLEHSLALVRLVRVVVPLYRSINQDLLIVGALLHDVGKIHEMSYERSFDYTDAGKLIGHITIGVELVSERIRQVDGFPRELAMLLKHMLLSHHGLYEYGSPKRPKTVEATILNYLDDMDSKINGIQAHIARESASSSRWTAHHRLYDRYFFKGNGVGGACDEAPAPQEQLPEAERKEPVREQPARGEQPSKKSFDNQPFRTLENLDLF